jgi:hypothetical protein
MRIETPATRRLIWRIFTDKELRFDRVGAVLPAPGSRPQRSRQEYHPAGHHLPALRISPSDNPDAHLHPARNLNVGATLRLDNGRAWN